MPERITTENADYFIEGSGLKRIIGEFRFVYGGKLLYGYSLGEVTLTPTIHNTIDIAHLEQHRFIRMSRPLSEHEKTLLTLKYGHPLL